MDAETRPLRRGWTTGACATAAVKAAYGALLGLGFADPVSIRLPRGGAATFALAEGGLNGDTAVAAIVKDAGDDPDVTHGCLVRATVSRAASGAGVTFHAGEGVGTVTRAGLQVPPGEPAINPVPRQMMRAAVAELAAACDVLIVAAAAGPGTRHMIDAGVLAALGPMGVLVNVARGSLVDEAALVAALESGGLGGAALDVFEHEPDVPEALRAMPETVLAPHVGSATVDTRRAMADLVLANLDAHFAGQPLPTAVA